MTNPSDAAEQAQEHLDQQLLVRLGELLGDAEPPPEQVLELARQSFALRTLDADLAALVEDSDLDRTLAVPVRDQDRPRPRQLAFQFFDGEDQLVIAMEVERRGPRLRLAGRLSPNQPVEIDIRQPGAPAARPVDVDQFGRFVVDDVLTGPMSLTCVRPGARPITTAWTSL